MPFFPRGPPNTVTAANARFLELEQALADADATSLPAEVHGLASALLAIGDEPVQQRLVEEVLPGEGAYRGRGVQALTDLADATARELAGTDFEFEPVLAPEDAPLADRLAAIVDWASGFLHGLGHAAGNTAIRERLAVEPLAELMRDLVEITRAEADDSAADEADNMLMVLTEHLRVIAQLFYDELAELRGAPSRDHDA